MSDSNLSSLDVEIPNHYSARLSELDMQMVISVPPGGNWKNIPDTIPSKRLEQIRESFAAGKGSRSTYYGRLHPDQPSYTINTNFNRPGNGCHIHYDYEGEQHRVLSQREAARLQSFPDSFVFEGSKTAINKQIGNAVPPLLAYQIAKTFPFCGQFVDLFSGAGGLSLGFKWAGWEPIIANDIQSQFLRTYSQNVHSSTVSGDIRDVSVFDSIVKCVKEKRIGQENTPLLVLGGPPCQGFSTAGNRRSMKDARNKLFFDYKAMLVALKPEGFIFENVTGLLNMEGGRIFNLIKTELQEATNSLSVWKLNAEQYGIPQRRTRLFLIGCSNQATKLHLPEQMTFFSKQPTLFNGISPAISVKDALSDLPPLEAGEDGSRKTYSCQPLYPYQALMRSQITASEYLKTLRKSHNR